MARGRHEALRRSIRSVTRQTDADWSLIVVADTSADSAGTTLQPWLHDRRVYLLGGMPALGTAAAKSRAIQAVNSEWIAFLEEGDELFPGFVCAWREVAASVPDLQFTWPGVEWTVPERGGQRRIWNDRWDGVRPHAHEILTAFDRCRALTVRRQALLRVRAFQEHFTYAQDVDMGMRLVAAGAAYAAMPQALVRADAGAAGSRNQFDRVDCYELLRLIAGNCALLDQQPRLSRHFRRLAMIRCYRQGASRMARKLAAQMLGRGELDLRSLFDMLRLEVSMGARRLRGGADRPYGDDS